MALGGPRWPSVVLGGHQDQDKSRWPHCHLRSHPGQGRRVLSALGGLGDVEVCGGPQDEVASMGTGWWPCVGTVGDTVMCMFFCA